METVQIRTFAAEDIPAVAQLFQDNFRQTGTIAPLSLQSYLHELFLEHPWFDPEIASRVYVTSKDKVIGFIGILPMRMSFRGQHLRAAVACSLMVDKPHENPIAGAKLMRSFLAGPQDFSFSETANPISQRMWKQLGGETAPYCNNGWIRALRPLGFAASYLGHWPARLLRPVTRLSDAAILQMNRNPLKINTTSKAQLCDEEADDELLCRLIPQLSKSFALHPQEDEQDLKWRLSHAAQKSFYGRLHRRCVFSKRHKALGCYLYYGQPGGTAYVLQILARHEDVDSVIDALMVHARDQGCIEIRGRTHPLILENLLHRRCLFVRSAATVVHSRNDELLKAIRSGEALIMGLAGETWTHLIDHTFK
jgi:hypothetical protein